MNGHVVQYRCKVILKHLPLCSHNASPLKLSDLGVVFDDYSHPIILKLPTSEWIHPESCSS